ncbi:MAG: NifB/NifX family molybdenum-iron cluster-binding protein [Desulfobacterales bacterium]|jgi:predicted Fe-Mo cluster-binding NifX family protein
MKIAISSSGGNLDEQVDPGFGCCRCFIVIDPETEAFYVLENEAPASSSGAGIQAAQMVVAARVDTVITGKLNPNVTDVLEAAGLNVYLGAAGTIRDVLKQYQDGRLMKASDSSVGDDTGTGPCKGHDTGRGMGQGVGQGMGQGMGQGQGMGRDGGFRAGPGGYCICPNCEERVPHELGCPCFENTCPKCGTTMTRELTD